MLALHFGSCLGCVEPVLLEWSVPCPGGSGQAQWERYFSGFGGFSGSYGRVIVRMLLTWRFSACCLYLGGGLSCPLSGMRLFCVGGEGVLGLRSIL